MLTRITALFRRIETEVEHDPEHALKLATAVLMLEVARADDHVDADEMSAIAATLREDFGLDAESAEAILALAGEASDSAVSAYPFTRELVDALSVEQRALVIQRLWRVALSDRRLDKFEEATIRKLADLLYVSHSAFIRAKLRAQAEIKAERDAP